MPKVRRSADSILILGGTTDARQLAQQLAADFPHCQLTMSLAGRTRAPRSQPIATRIGGFGGANGLADWLVAHNITLLIIATHPFAAQMPVNAVMAAQHAGIPVLRLLRPSWQPQLNDDWEHCHSLDEAAALLGESPQRVFLPIGRQSVASFVAAPHHHYVVRSIEPLDKGLALPHLHTIQERGPFSLHAEKALMQHWEITRMVCKNSGGESMAEKLHAARLLNIPVIMVERPLLPVTVMTFNDSASLTLALPDYITVHS